MWHGMFMLLFLACKVMIGIAALSAVRLSAWGSLAVIFEPYPVCSL